MQKMTMRRKLDHWKNDHFRWIRKIPLRFAESFNWHLNQIAFLWMKISLTLFSNEENECDPITIGFVLQLTREHIWVFKPFTLHLLATDRRQRGMKNLKRICPLVPLFSRYWIFKLHTKRDQNEKLSFLEHCRVFRRKSVAVSPLAYLMCSPFTGRSYFIRITSSCYLSAHRAIRIPCFTSVIVVCGKTLY